jgi:hypothetical protein
LSGPFPSGHKVLSTDLNPILLGWIDMLAWFGTTLAYVSADAPTFTFSLDADVTGVVEPGMRVKLTQTTDKFFIVTAVGAFAAGVTPITVYGGTDYVLANAAISAGSFSTHKKPFGFNSSPLKWTETLADTSTRSQASPSLGTWYNPGSLSLSVPVGAWRLFYEALVFGTGISADIQDVFATLSTANNSESDSAFTSYIQAVANPTVFATPHREKHLLLAVKTSYFLNVKAAVSSSSIGTRGDVTPTSIRAVCAYL